VKAFVDDRSPNAYEKVIDKLLQSPHYGENWGRHWLDIAGYSDSVGDANDTEREAAWKYRDYVINAFNKNKPYDRFLLEQFAGDQLINYKPGASPKPEEVEILTATGFLRMTPDITDNQTIYQVDKYFDALEKATETSLKAVMGLQFACARCHDHKFDPILQKDYYRLTSVFQATFDPENWVAANLISANGRAVWCSTWRRRSESLGSKTSPAIRRRSTVASSCCWQQPMTGTAKN
jgi:hypothetical protein